MRDITLEETAYFFFTTRAITGVPALLDGTPVLSVLEQNNATPITAGVSVDVDRASVVGLNQATVDATGANGYAAGSYCIYISTGTVNSVSAVGEVVAEFTIDASAALKAIDLQNDLSAAEVNTEVDNAIVTYGLDHLVAAAVVGADVTDDSIIANMVSKSATPDWDSFVNTSDALEAIADAGITDPWGVAVPGSYTAGEAGFILGNMVPNSGLTASSNGTTTTLIDDALTQADDYWNGATIVFHSGSADNDVARTVTDFVASSDTLTFAPALLTATASADVYSLIPSNDGVVEVDANGRVDVGFIAGTAQTAGDVTAAVITNAVGADVSADIATAQADLDIITGASGVNLLTATQASIDAIELDTGTTLDGKIDTAQADLDIITGASGVNLLTATQASIDAIELDTGTTLDGKIDTAQADLDIITGASGVNLLTATQASIDAIETDTTTDIPATIATIDTIVDNLNLGIIYGETSGTPSTTASNTDLTGYADDELIGRTIVFTSGTADGQASDITDYANTSGVVTYTAITTAPAAADTFKIV